MGEVLRDADRRWPAAVRAWVCEAPGTWVWLLVLAVTAAQSAQLPRTAREALERADSTNLVQLAHHPLRVLVLSALWTPPAGLWWTAVVFAVLVAPAERRLGSGRWLAVVAAAHVGATLIAEGVLWLAIRTGHSGAAERYAPDVGVSYGVAGAAGALARLLRPPWRWAFTVAAFVLLAGRLALFRTFTDLGHLVAFGIGLCCRPPARRRAE